MTNRLFWMAKRALAAPVFASLAIVIASALVSTSAESAERAAAADGNQTNYAEEADWARLAAQQGDVTAQTRLGILYYSGNGALPQDDVAALSWLWRAAHQNDPRAQAYLGLMYAQGRAVVRDPVLAQVWFNLAATQGDRLAQLIGPKNAAELTVAEVAAAATSTRDWRQAHEARLQRPVTAERSE